MYRGSTLKQVKQGKAIHSEKFKMVENTFSILVEKVCDLTATQAWEARRYWEGASTIAFVAIFTPQVNIIITFCSESVGSFVVSTAIAKIGCSFAVFMELNKVSNSLIDPPNRQSLCDISKSVDLFLIPLCE